MANLTRVRMHEVIVASPRFICHASNDHHETAEEA
jgi:hypothetical protein